MAHWDLDVNDEGVRRQSAGELLPKVLPLFLPHRRLLLSAIGLLLLVTASQLAGPLILQHIIDDIVPAHNVPGLLRAAGLYVAIICVGAGVGYLQTITLFTLGIRTVTSLKSRLFEHVLRLGLGFHEQHSPGKLISRVESDTETLKELFGEVTVNLLRNALLFIGILVVLCIKQMALAAWLLVLLPVLFGIAFSFMVWMRRYWRAMRAQWAAVTGYVTEYVQGVEVIQQFKWDPLESTCRHASLSIL